MALGCSPRASAGEKGLRTTEPTQVFLLPATHPDDPTFGNERDLRWEGPEELHPVEFERLVWYNPEVRRECFKKMLPHLKAQNLLVGFSKSGLGALHLFLDHPGTFAGCLVFDAPLAIVEKPDWIATEFFSVQDWKDDLLMDREQELVGHPGSIVLMGGANFHAQHREFCAGVQRADLVVHDDPSLVHHWSSGWFELGLSTLLKNLGS